MLASFAILWLAASPVWGKTVQIDEKSNGKRIQLKVGDTLEIHLGENASTGFTWTSTQAHEPVLTEKDRTVEGVAGRPGSPGQRHIHYEAVHPGTAEVELHYRRPWEKKDPARTFKLHVEVK